MSIENCCGNCCERQIRFMKEHKKMTALTIILIAVVKVYFIMKLMERHHRR